MSQENINGTGTPLPSKASEQPSFNPAEFPAYYEPGRKNIWIQNSRQGWIEVNETALRRLLKSQGYSVRRGSEFVSPLDQQLIKIQTEKDIAYAGALAGHQIGVHEISGNRILVTTAPKLIEPKAGEFPTVMAFLKNLLVTSDCDQLPYVFGWLKMAYESLASGRHRPGQALALAGPPASGKSLAQNLFTEILGGRAAKPYRYMSGGTDFNGDLFGSEHLMIEDDIGTTDIRSRRNFGTRIKEFTVNQVQSCHAKQRQAISLTPFWRLSISLNEEPENLLILPPFDESLRDKIILLKTNRCPMPMPTGTESERVHFWNTLISELPAFIWFLQHWEIPPDLRSDRFGITHFHHPGLLSDLDMLAPEIQLMELIDRHLQVSALDSTPWRGTAAMLRSDLLKCPEVGREAGKLLEWSGAVGTYLGRLAKKHPDRFKYLRSAEQRQWTIKPSAQMTP